MDTAFVVLVLLAALSGICLALIGIAFRIGQTRGVIPLHISMCMGIAGAIFFGAQMDWSALGELPLFVFVMALLTTAGQIGAMHLVRVCLARGPLSPLWSAMNLTFLPVVIYAAVVFSESVTSWQLTALAAGVLCVIFASNMVGQGKAEASAQTTERDINTKLIYAGLLVLVLIGNSLVFIVIKDLGTRTVAPGSETTWLAEYVTPIYFIMYLGLALFSGLTAWLQRAKPDRAGDLVWLGLLAACGSISGLLLLKVCMVLPAALVFTISGMITILSGAVASVIFFREPIFWAWYGTVGFGSLAVLLANMDRLIG